MGAGQFCTCPGLVLGVAGPALDSFVARAAEVRRALAVEIKALGARLKALEPKAEEARELLKKRQELLKEFKATAPAK